MTARRRRAARPAALLPAAVLLLTGCAQDRQPAVPTGTFERNGVTVKIELREAPDGGSQVRATFSPQQTGFHLYSIDLPVGGISGLGIPTHLAVGGVLTARGKPSADRELRKIHPSGLDVELPVYPDGPVTVTLPVTRQGAGAAQAVVSYGACSEQRCLIPVTDQVVPLG